MPTRVVSVVLAATLAITMMPADSIALGLEQASSASDNAEATDSTASSEQTAAVRSSGVISSDHPIRKATDAALQEDVADSADSADRSAAIQEGAPSAQDGIEIVSASVQLGEDASALISYNGLTYLQDADSATVALVGWSGVAPEGALQIPAQIVYNEQTYTVTAIENAGGGFTARPE